MKTRSLTALLVMIMIFLAMSLFFQEGFGGKSKAEPCWPTNQMNNVTQSAYSELCRAYSLPPAWSDSMQEDYSPQPNAKLQARSGLYEALNWS